MVIIPDFDMRHHTVLVTGAAGLLGKYHEALIWNWSKCDRY